MRCDWKVLSTKNKILAWHPVVRRVLTNPIKFDGNPKQSVIIKSEELLEGVVYGVKEHNSQFEKLFDKKSKRDWSNALKLLLIL